MEIRTNERSNLLQRHQTNVNKANWIDLRERIQMMDQTSESWFSEGDSPLGYCLFSVVAVVVLRSIILFNRFGGRCGSGGAV
jgi:hypothetical protein